MHLLVCTRKCIYLRAHSVDLRASVYLASNAMASTTVATVATASSTMVTRMVAGAKVADTASLANSPTGFPITGVAAAMISPEWLVAGSDVEAEEDVVDTEKKQDNEVDETYNSAGDNDGAGIPKFVQPYIAGGAVDENTAMMASIEAITGGTSSTTK